MRFTLNILIELLSSLVFVSNNFVCFKLKHFTKYMALQLFLLKVMITDCHFSLLPQYLSFPTFQC